LLKEAIVYRVLQQKEKESYEGIPPPISNPLIYLPSRNSVFLLVWLWRRLCNSSHRTPWSMSRGPLQPLRKEILPEMRSHARC